jgi:hypothetical protein
MRIGAGLLLIAVGAILRFGLATVSTHGIALHTIGDILMIVGVLGVVLWLVVSAPWSRRRPAYREDAPVYREERVVYREDARTDEVPRQGTPPTATRTNTGADPRLRVGSGPWQLLTRACPGTSARRPGGR